MEIDVNKFPQWLTVQATTARQIAANYGVAQLVGHEKFYNYVAEKFDDLAHDLQERLNLASAMLPEEKPEEPKP